ncbi:MAG: hypothetical protein Q9162_005949 [Coniocarpon cinnabarinum]
MSGLKENAPDVHFINDMYILFYAVSSYGTQNSVIGYTTSTNLEPGTWIDHGPVISSNSSCGFNAIDANLIGPTLLGFGSYWGGIQQVHLGNNYQPLGAPYSVARNTTPSSNNDAIEGSYTFQHGSYWYLTFSSGACCHLDTSNPAPGSEYKIMVCRARNPAGPFLDRDKRPCMDSGGTILLESHDDVYAPGGQGVLQDGDATYIYYHYLNTTMSIVDNEVQWGVNVVDWDDDQWPTV